LPQHLAVQQAVAVLNQPVSTYFRLGFLNILHSFLRQNNEPNIAVIIANNVTKPTYDMPYVLCPM
jgi:hypothetical protein